MSWGSLPAMARVVTGCFSKAISVGGRNRNSSPGRSAAGSDGGADGGSDSGSDAWSGFSLHPQMRMVGTVNRATLPAITGLREGRDDDIDWMNHLDRRLRGAGHGPDHTYMRGTLRLVVSRAYGRPGYVYIDDQGRAALLAAAHPATAQDLLWEALASGHFL
ncbi:hypothetical protein [Streptomyces sp. MK37H]|uniref:hypothetical protein n=1 Tax=Streptomyces sp. MK37H TaxID=2699117 RepID=UPI001B3691B4|nr:hypothetical protein [Streptomyces sp. MK37H]MBP8537238.1 hypothetical protein [Streptomyces sp. MK37H]